MKKSNKAAKNTTPGCACGGAHTPCNAALSTPPGLSAPGVGKNLIPAELFIPHMTRRRAIILSDMCWWWTYKSTDTEEFGRAFFRPINSIAGRFHIDKANVTRDIQYLVANGWVEDLGIQYIVDGHKRKWYKIQGKTEVILGLFLAGKKTPVIKGVSKENNNLTTTSQQPDNNLTTTSQQLIPYTLDPRFPKQCFRNLKITPITNKMKSVKGPAGYFDVPRDTTRDEVEEWITKVQPIIAKAETICGMSPRASYGNGPILNLLDALSSIEITEDELIQGLVAFFKSDKYTQLDRKDHAMSYFATGILNWVAAGESVSGGASRRDIVYYKYQGDKVLVRDCDADGKPVVNEYDKNEFNTLMQEVLDGNKIWDMDPITNKVITPKFKEEK